MIILLLHGQFFNSVKLKISYLADCTRQNMEYKNSDPIIRFRMVNFSARKINMMIIFHIEEISHY